MTPFVRFQRFTARAALLALAVGALAVAGPAGAEDTPIQPGAVMRSSIGACTLNWVYRDTGAPAAQARLYVGTAAHCVSGVGAEIEDLGGRPVGRTVYSRFSGTDDFALVQVYPDRYADVNPSLRVWGGPTGVSDYTKTGFLAPLKLYGNGVIFSATAVTRPREGLLYYDDARYYRADLPVAFGDSGGPVLDAGTGAALGIVSRLAVITGTLEGPTVLRFLEKLAEEGLNVEVVTAPYPAAPAV